MAGHYLFRRKEKGPPVVWRHGGSAARFGKPKICGEGVEVRTPRGKFANQGEKKSSLLGMYYPRHRCDVLVTIFTIFTVFYLLYYQ